MFRILLFAYLPLLALAKSLPWIEPESEEEQHKRLVGMYMRERGYTKFSELSVEEIFSLYF